MPSKSKSQQRLFGAVHACQKHGKCASPEISKIADNISASDAEDFASTKHKGLPERKKKKKLKSFQEFRENLGTYAKQVAGMTMGADPSQVHQNAQASGFNFNQARRILMKWLSLIEKGLEKNVAPQSGEDAANNFHPQAVEVIQNLLQQAASGKKSWSVQQHASAMKHQQQSAPSQPQQGPTHVDEIG